MLLLIIGLTGIAAGGLLIGIHFLRELLADCSREVAADALGIEPGELRLKGGEWIAPRRHKGTKRVRH